MDLFTTTATKAEPKFKVQESNYLVETSDGMQYVVESWQFQKILPLLNDPKVEFISINQSIENKRFIRRFTPTDKDTDDQTLAKARHEAIHQQELEDRRQKSKEKEDLLQRKREFDVRFYGAKYGDNWSFLRETDVIHRINKQDMQESMDAFLASNDLPQHLIDLLANEK